MSNAYNAVIVDGVSVYAASKIYGVPEQTLRDRVKGVIGIECVTTGRAPVFSFEEEGKLVKRLTEMARLGYSYTRQELTHIASDYAIHLDKRSVNSPLSIHWFHSFRKRWTCIKDVQTGTIESERVRFATSTYVNNCFQELDAILSKYDLRNSPHLIFNINESGFIPNKKPPFVVTSAEFDFKQQTAASPRSTKIVTVIAAGSASGVAIPPYFVFPGAKMMPNLLKNGTPGVSGSVSKTGWSNTDVFRQYLKTHFYKYIPDREPDQYVLILLDGHSSHIAVDVMEWATENNIIIFVLPNNTSDILQPLDVSCYAPLYVYFNHLCHSLTQDSSNNDMCGFMCKAYSKAVSTENLSLGFKKCGIYPFDKDAIPLSSLEPTSISIDNIAHEEEVDSENKYSVGNYENVIDY